MIIKNNIQSVNLYLDYCRAMGYKVVQVDLKRIMARNCNGELAVYSNTRNRSYRIMALNYGPKSQ